MSDEKFNKEMMEKIDDLIKITSANVTKDMKMAGKILFLGNLGFSPKKISEILNSTQNYVNLILSKNRKKLKEENRTSFSEKSEEIDDKAKEETNEN